MDYIYCTFHYSRKTYFALLSLCAIFALIHAKVVNERQHTLKDYIALVVEDCAAKVIDSIYTTVTPTRAKYQSTTTMH